MSSSLAFAATTTALSSRAAVAPRRASRASALVSRRAPRSVTSRRAPGFRASAAASDGAALVADVAEDIFATTGVGPALCVAGTIYIAYVVFSGYETIKRLKEELTDLGYDVEQFNRVGELKAIRRAVDDGTVDQIYDKVWYQRAVLAAGSGSIVDVQKAQAYWAKRGVKVKTLADLDKVTAYMVKKYGADAKMNSK
jgi:hypothetical protein